MKILPALLLCLPLAAHAEWGQFEVEFDQDKPWTEVTAQLPPYPEAENLIAFDVSSATPHRHFVDVASISIGEDQVVRYTVVIDAAGGARNVSFEGMRCETGERRLYAYGQPDGSWSKARTAGWEPIRFRLQRSYHKALYEDHFCPDGVTVRSAEAAVRGFQRRVR